VELCFTPVQVSNRNGGGQQPASGFLRLQLTASRAHERQSVGVGHPAGNGELGNGLLSGGNCHQLHARPGSTGLSKS